MRLRTMLAIASFIIHYPEQKTTALKIQMRFEFCELGDGVSAIFTK